MTTDTTHQNREPHKPDTLDPFECEAWQSNMWRARSWQEAERILDHHPEDGIILRTPTHEQKISESVPLDGFIHGGTLSVWNIPIKQAILCQNKRGISDCVIRIARDEDLSHLLKLAHQTNWHDYAQRCCGAELSRRRKALWIEKRWELIKNNIISNNPISMRGDGSIAVVAEQDGIVCAFAIALSKQPPHTTWSLDLIAVAPHYQGNGLAQSLMVMISKTIFQDRATVFLAGTDSHNTQSMKLYRKLGGSITSTLITHVKLPQVWRNKIPTPNTLDHR